MGEGKRLGFRFECRKVEDSGILPNCNRECIDLGKVCVDLRVVAEEVAFIRISKKEE